MRSNIITKADRPELLITKHLNENVHYYTIMHEELISISIPTRQEKI
jgi:hypothetical protein